MRTVGRNPVSLHGFEFTIPFGQTQDQLHGEKLKWKIFAHQEIPSCYQAVFFHTVTKGVP